MTITNSGYKQDKMGRNVQSSPHPSHPSQSEVPQSSNQDSQRSPQVSGYEAISPASSEYGSLF